MCFGFESFDTHCPCAKDGAAVDGEGESSEDLSKMFEGFHQTCEEFELTRVALVHSDACWTARCECQHCADSATALVEDR